MFRILKEKRKRLKEQRQSSANNNSKSETEADAADAKMTPLEHFGMLKATGTQLKDQGKGLDADGDAGLLVGATCTGNPTGSSPSPAKRARVELDTAQVGRKTASSSYTSSSTSSSSTAELPKQSDSVTADIHENHVSSGQSSLDTPRPRERSKKRPLAYAAYDNDSDEFEQDNDHSNKIDEIDELVREADDSNGSDESDSDEFAWQNQGTRSHRFEVHQYCENLDELQHDEQEEELNHDQHDGQKLTWDESIQDLKDFKETFGHCRVTRTFTGNPALARFVKKVREYKVSINKGTSTRSLLLTSARIKELDDLGFQWSNVQKKISFEQRIEQLEAFKATHGHLHVSVALDKKLNKFCCHMRQARLKPDPRGMTINEERIQALDKVGFEWTTVRRTDSSFERRIEQLKAFKAAHGHLHVTATLDKNLNIFVRDMRHARLKPDSRGTTINDERIQALDEVGFEWTTVRRTESLFEQRIEQLEAFKATHGHLHVTATLDKNLNIFCRDMRQSRLKPDAPRMTINEERIQALDEVGFEWGTKRIPK